MHMRASRASWRLQMWLWFEFPMHFEYAASESIPKHCFCCARTLASAEGVIIIKRNPHERPSHYVRNARESVEPRLSFLSASTARRACRPDHYIRIVWELPSAEAITCVASNDSRALEPIVLSSGIDFDAFRSVHFWSRASAKSICFIKQNKWRPLGGTPPSTVVFRAHS